MSDYISKSEMIHKIRGVVPSSQDVDFIVRLIEEQPTLDEKEIIRKAVKRIKARLEGLMNSMERYKCDNEVFLGEYRGFGIAIEICEEEGGIE